MTPLVGVFGASGCAKDTLPVLRQQLARSGMAETAIVFVDRQAGPPLNGVPVIGEADFLTRTDERVFVVAIADGRLRQRLHGAAVASGARPLTLRADSAEVLGRVEMGDGAILCSRSILTADIRIGVGLHLNLNSYIAHDCLVGDWVTFAQNVACNGNVVIGDHVYIGTGALIRQGTPKAPLVIGAGAVIGMGAVVTRSVAPGVTVVGNPARPLQKG